MHIRKKTFRQAPGTQKHAARKRKRAIKTCTGCLFGISAFTLTLAVSNMPFSKSLSGSWQHFTAQLPGIRETNPAGGSGNPAGSGSLADRFASGNISGRFGSGSQTDDSGSSGSDNPAGSGSVSDRFGSGSMADASGSSAGSSVSGNPAGSGSVPDRFGSGSMTDASGNSAAGSGGSAGSSENPAGGSESMTGNYYSGNSAGNSSSGNTDGNSSSGSMTGNYHSGSSADSSGSGNTDGRSHSGSSPSGSGSGSQPDTDAKPYSYSSDSGKHQIYPDGSGISESPIYHSPRDTDTQWIFYAETGSGSQVLSGSERLPQESVPDAGNSNASHITYQSFDWNLILANPWNELPDGFQIQLARLPDGHSIDSRCYSALMDMLNACRDEGYSPLICSSYRTPEKQESLFQERIDELISQGYPEKEAQAKAATSVARPGTSEHQLGLAVDIADQNYQALDAAQADTPTQQWLMKNSWKYGFILRYPNEKSQLTGIIYEPWHYRYVGVKAAQEIFESGVCLEEYLETLS